MRAWRDLLGGAPLPAMLTADVITVQPTFDTVKGYADAEFGSFSLEHVRAAVNLPLSSTFAVRLAGDFITQRGYVLASEVPGDFRLADKHNYHVRLTALFQPNDDFSLSGSLEYAHVVQHEPESKNILDPNPNPWVESSDWPGLYNNVQTIGTIIAGSESPRWVDAQGSQIALRRLSYSHF